jgi:hypothetical protein
VFLRSRGPQPRASRSHKFVGARVWGGERGKRARKKTKSLLETTTCFRFGISREGRGSDTQAPRAAPRTPAQMLILIAHSGKTIELDCDGDTRCVARACVRAAWGLTSNTLTNQHRFERDKTNVSPATAPPPLPHFERKHARARGEGGERVRHARYFAVCFCATRRGVREDSIASLSSLTDTPARVT